MQNADHPKQAVDHVNRSLTLQVSVASTYQSAAGCLFSHYLLAAYNEVSIP